MKFEKINNDKIKVTINSDDLDKNNIDFNSFMSDSNESKSLFLDVLDTAERDFGFSTRDYSLRVETVAMSDGIFVLTITRISDDENIKGASNSDYDSNSNTRKNLKVNRKKPSLNTSVIYKFNCFDDFSNFSELLNSINHSDSKKVAKDITLFLYNSNYYLVFDNINMNFKELRKVFSMITEFATYVNSSDVFKAKLYESRKNCF